MAKDKFKYLRRIPLLLAALRYSTRDADYKINFLIKKVSDIYLQIYIYPLIDSIV